MKKEDLVRIINRLVEYTEGTMSREDTPEDYAQLMEDVEEAQSDA